MFIKNINFKNNSTEFYLYFIKIQTKYKLNKNVIL